MFEHPSNPALEQLDARDLPQAGRDRRRRLSPEDTARRTEPSASASGWRSRNRASWDQKVGRRSARSRSRATMPSTARGVGIVPDSTAVAPRPGRGRSRCRTRAT